MKLMGRRLLNYSQRLRRLRFLALAFALALLLPLSTLLYFAYQQLEKNLLLEHVQDANNLVSSVNRKLFKKLTSSNSLPVHAFDYYQQVYNPVTKDFQQVISALSRLDVSQLSVEQQIGGLIGYFQYDVQGRFNSPIWPYPATAEDISDVELKQADTELSARKNIAANLQQILSNSSKIQQVVQQSIKVKEELFYVAFDLADYFVFYRQVSVAGQKRVQGYVVERKAYMQQTLTAMLELRRFSIPVLIRLQERKPNGQIERFVYANAADGQTKVSQPVQISEPFQQQLIYQSNLLHPFRNYSISVSASDLPMTAAMLYSMVFIGILIIAILFACYGFYRLGLSQLGLAEQRLNFVSSVSHELKTPLTSIRMYSEMLKDGTVISQQHQQDYFTFIFSESERLTRLINNILQLSKISHQQQNVKPEYVQLSVLQDIIRSKTSSILSKHGFQQNLQIHLPTSENVQVLVEQDAFAQVIINITDNAVKFFDEDQIDDPERKKIDFIFRLHPKHKHQIQLEIRDYGHGITPEQQSKMFDLFYRGGNELTRTTQGTGIGLALVKELMLAQQGEVEVTRTQPGLALLLAFQSNNVK